MRKFSAWQPLIILMLDAGLFFQGIERTIPLDTSREKSLCILLTNPYTDHQVQRHIVELYIKHLAHR